MDYVRLKSINGPDTKLVDGDTEITESGKRERLLGINTRETARVHKNRYGEESFQLPKQGSFAQTKAVQSVIDKGGFVYKDNTGEYDKYNRELIERYNLKGEKLSDTLVAEGIAEVNRYTSPGAVRALWDRKKDQELGLYDSPYEDIAQETRDILGSSFVPKTMALDERSYDPNYHTGVMARHHDRYLESDAFDEIGNTKKGFFGQIGEGWDQGWLGVAEGFYGYMDAIGTVTDSEMIETWGEQGVLDMRERMRRSPSITLDYREVNGVGDAFQYVLNNAAMSAPYMVTTFASMAAAVPVALAAGAASPALGVAALLGMTYIPNSMIYGGHTWNEMEGEKGLSQFMLASTAGVGAAILDRLGLKGLVSPNKVLSKEGAEAVAQHLTKRSRGVGKKITIEEAREQVANATKAETSNYLKGIMSLRNISPDQVIKDYAKSFSPKEVAKMMGKGAATEALTEIAQESLQYGMAVAGSDKTLDSEEFKHRLINAGVAGSSLGGGLSGAANIYSQGKEQLHIKGLEAGDLDRYRVIEKARMEKLNNGEEIRSTDQNLDWINQQIASKKPLIPVSGSTPQIEKTRNKYAAEITLGGLTGKQLGVLGQELAFLKDLKKELAKATKELNTAEVNRLNNAIAAQLDKVKNVSLETLDDFSGDDEAVEDLGQQILAVNEVRREKGWTDPKYDNEPTHNKDTIAGRKLLIKDQDAELEKRKNQGIEGQGNRFITQLAEEYASLNRGLKNFVKQPLGPDHNNGIEDYISAMSRGFTRLYRSAERSAADINKLVKDPDGMIILSIIGQLTQGVYHSGMGFRQFYDRLISDLKKDIDERGIAISLGFEKGMKSDYVEPISDWVKEFANDTEGTSILNLFKEWSAQNENQGLTPAELEASWQNYFIENIAARPQMNKAKASLLFSTRINNREKYGYQNASALFDISKSLKDSWNYLIEKYKEASHKEAGNILNEADIIPSDHWRNATNFDWKKVRNNRGEFLKWCMDNGIDAQKAEALYQFIAYRNQANFVKGNSHIDGIEWVPTFLQQDYKVLETAAGRDKFTTSNLFEPLHKAQMDVAKYVTIVKYFGPGGEKLNFLLGRMMERAKSRSKNSVTGKPDPTFLSENEVKQFAWYVKAMIDADHGNFNTIQSPFFAALNRFLVSWSIFAGLPLAALSSIPETAMIYYGLQGDDQWTKANEQLVTQFAQLWSKAARHKVKDLNRLLDLTGIRYDQNTVIDRFATGERDIYYANAHDFFFKLSLIKDYTQIQRRMAGGLALDFVQDYTNVLLSAPRQTGAEPFNSNTQQLDIRFDFKSFNSFELEAYNQLSSIGIDVELLVREVGNIDEIYRSDLFDYSSTPDLDSYSKEPSKQLAALGGKRLNALWKNEENRPDGPRKGKAELQEVLDTIDEQVQTAVYRFVNDRIMMPQSTNRPLFFQDPRYQLLTQFNGFIATFTATVLPRLWDSYLRKGNPQVKYNTFAVIVLMLGMGGASQYLKDLLKYGKPSPWMDTAGYTQRAIYASGLLGQGERVVDALYPLYPDRDDRFVSTVLGETGPAARNIQNVVKGVGNLLVGETERGLNNVLKAAPWLGPFTGTRKSTVELAHGKNPLDDATFKLW